MSKQFAVLGLGSFGWSVALTLEKMGADVLVVDDSAEKIQEISEDVSYALKADVSDPEALEALGGRNLDGAVVAVSENFEASIMATMLCKDMGIPKVLAKAKDKLQGTILKKVGADAVVYPEIEMGSRVAKNLVAKEFPTGSSCPTIIAWSRRSCRNRGRANVLRSSAFVNVSASTWSALSSTNRLTLHLTRWSRCRRTPS